MISALGLRTLGSGTHGVRHLAITVVSITFRIGGCIRTRRRFVRGFTRTFGLFSCLFLCLLGSLLLLFALVGFFFPLLVGRLHGLLAFPPRWKGGRLCVVGGTRGRKTPSIEAGLDVGTLRCGRVVGGENLVWLRQILVKTNLDGHLGRVGLLFDSARDGVGFGFFSL